VSARLNVYRRTVKRGDVVIDGGAAIGTYTREALASGASRIIAVEPLPANIECLQRNLSSEIRAGRVTIYPKGLWDKEDTLVMHGESGHLGRGSFLSSDSRQETEGRLPLTTIDRIVAELGLARIDVVKMDIEGAKQNALRGGAAVLRRWKPRMVISAYHRTDDWTAIPALVARIEPRYATSVDHCVVTGWMQIAPEVQLFW